MTLKLFLAICILGLDVLIYLLFHWTLGEKGRTSRRRPKANRHLETGQQTGLVALPAHRQVGQKLAKILHYPNGVPIKQAAPNENWVTEEMAHRRRVRAFRSPKKTAKLAV